MSSLSETRRAAGVVHPCLASPPRSIALAEARLTDRRKVAALLEAAGLLSLLERAGWRLAEGWERGAHLAGGPAGGRRGGRRSRPLVPPLPGDAARPRRAAVRRGSGRRARGGAAGRPRADRPLAAGPRCRCRRTRRWRRSWRPRPFSGSGRSWRWPARRWRGRSCARTAASGRGSRARGPSAPACSARGARRARSVELLATAGARALWNGEEAGSPRELAAAGRWRAAVAAWERQPPRDDEERVERATALAALGRREAALEALAGLASAAARVLAIRCQLELGRLGAARTALRGFEEAALAPAEVAELAEIASRVYASHGKPERAGYWIRRALDETSGDPRAALLARLAAAGAAWDRQDADALERFLAASRGALDDPGPRLALAPAPRPAGRRGRRPGRRGGRRRAGDPRRPPAADPAPGRGALERPRARPRPPRRSRRGRARLSARRVAGGGLRRPGQDRPSRCTTSPRSGCARGAPRG